MRTEVTHVWAVTAGTRPPAGPLCPLTEPRYQAAVAQYHRLLGPVDDDAPALQVVLADMAAAIPPRAAVFWYQLVAVVETTWVPVAPGTDPAPLAQAARAQAATAVLPPVSGDHPGTVPAPTTVTALARPRWLTAPEGHDPNDPAEAQAPVATPTTGARWWYSLRLHASSGWVPADQDTDPRELIDAITERARTP